MITAHGGKDINGKGMHYLEWTFTPAAQEHIIFKDFTFLLKDESGTVKVEYDRHIKYSFGREGWELVEVVWCWHYYKRELEEKHYLRS